MGGVEGDLSTPFTSGDKPVRWWLGGGGWGGGGGGGSAPIQ